MAGGDESPEAAQLRGLGKYFNSVTVTGRANVAKATYAFFVGLGLFLWLKPKKPPVPKQECCRLRQYENEMMKSKKMSSKC